jgi:hypothetical protein
MNILTEIVKIKALGNTITFSVTAGFVLGLKGIYEVIQETIYLYIPLLTMNLMSREYSSGSIKLLYSSPIKTTIPQTPEYEKLGLKIENSANGDFFEIYGTYNGTISEFKKFIDNAYYTNNRYYVNYTITVYEQNIRGRKMPWQ